MPEWFVENGIAEDRAILVENGTVLAARMEWPGKLAAGEVADAILVSRSKGSSRGTARFPGNEEALVDGLPQSASEGATIRLEITRAAIAEAGRMKRAQTRPTQANCQPAPSLAHRLKDTGEHVRIVRRFPEDPWPDIVGDAITGAIEFSGGSLIITPTPAMTLIDIDGSLPPAALALAAVRPIAHAIAMFDLGGSIGIDFPTLERRDERRSVDESLASALDHWPHQRTAMNGFGFVQLVARLERPSILHRVRADPAGAAARLLLRRAEAVSEPGVLQLVSHPAVRSAIKPEWESELSHRTGRSIVWREDSALALAGGFAQAVAP